MFTYVALMSFTDKGIQNVKDTVVRAKAAKEAALKFGVKMGEIYWTMGEYDFVCVLEAEDEASLTAFGLAIAMQGNIRSHSMRAFLAPEMERIVARLP